MREALSPHDTLPLAERIAAALERANETITSLDAQIGDGDLGVTCRSGMKAVTEALASLVDAPLHEAPLKAAMAFNAEGTSTFGALVGTALVRAGKYLREQEVDKLDLPAFRGALEAAAEGIQQRGKAARGDKTLLDSLWPAIESLEAAQQRGASLSEGLMAAAAAAQEGAEATKPLRSKKGRAAWMQDRTVGVQDAGATVVAVVLAAIAGYVRSSD